MTVADRHTHGGLAETARESLWHWGVQIDALEDGPLVLDRGEGCRVWDIDGNSYIDAISGLGVVQVGHGREEIASAMADQARRLGYGSLANGYSNRPAIELAWRLSELAPLDSPRVFFGSGGGEAIETAIKLARQHFVLRGQPDRHKVIGREGSYHGVTLGALSATGVDSMREPFQPLVPGFRHVSHPDVEAWDGDPAGCAEAAAESLERTILEEGPDTVAAFVAEPVSTAGSIKVPPDEYWPKVAGICTDHGVLLIVDEIFTGFGRTGRMFATEHWDIRPDMMTVAKGLASGYAPLSAVIVDRDVAETFRGPESHQFQHASTWSGHPVSATAALANLQILEGEDLPTRAAAMGRLLGEGLEEILQGSEAVTARAGIGLMHSLRLDPEVLSAPDAVRALRDIGVLTRCSSTHLFVYPPLVINEEVVGSILDSLREVLVDGQGPSA